MQAAVPAPSSWTGIAYLNGMRYQLNKGRNDGCTDRLQCALGSRVYARGFIHGLVSGSRHCPWLFSPPPDFLPAPYFVQVVWKHAWVLSIAWFVCAQSFPLQLCHFPLLGCSDNSKMPRRRGISRHGGNTGNRGRASHSAPQNVIPIASTSPSSPPSGHDRPLPHNSFQTTCFTFHSRLNRPLLSASITVILAEEEDKPSSSAHTTTSQSQDDSVLQGEMVGVVFNEDNMQEDSIVPEAPQPPADSSQREVLACGPIHHPGSILNLIIPPDGGIEGNADNEFVTWIASSSQVDKDAPDSPQHAE